MSATMQLSLEHRHVHVERLAALHAERGCVDQQRCVAGAVGAVAPVVHVHLRPEVGSDGIGAIARAVEDTHLRLRQHSSRANTMPRAAPPAPRTATVRAAEPKTGHRRPQAVHETRAVGVVGNQLVALEPQRIGGAGSTRGRPRFGRGRKGRFLVGQRDVAAGEALRRAWCAGNRRHRPAATGWRT